jgi:hypothetical protein
MGQRSPTPSPQIALEPTSPFKVALRDDDAHDQVAALGHRDSVPAGAATHVEHIERRGEVEERLDPIHILSAGLRIGERTPLGDARLGSSSYQLTIQRFISMPRQATYAGCGAFPYAVTVRLIFVVLEIIDDHRTVLVQAGENGRRLNFDCPDLDEPRLGFGT